MRPLRDVSLGQLRQLFENSERVVRVYKQDGTGKVRYLALFPEKPYPSALDEDPTYKYAGVLNLQTGAIARAGQPGGQDDGTTAQDEAPAMTAGRAAAKIGWVLVKGLTIWFSAAAWLLMTLATAIGGRSGRRH